MIDIEKISKSYSRDETGLVAALKEASFTIAPGVFVIVKAASGCGKSTLLNIIC